MKKEILIAIFAAVTLAVTVWGYKFISGKNLFSGNYTYYAYYDNVQDVNTATAVQINGYEVGTVLSIAPDPENIQRIRLEFSVKKDIKLPDYTVAELMPESPLGGKVIELRFDKMCTGSNCAPNKSTLQGKTVGILGSMIKADELESTMDVLSTTIDSTLGSLGDPNSNAAVDVSVRNLATTLENFAEISEKFNKLMGSSSRNMEITMANVAKLTSSLVESNEKINTMLDDLSGVTADLKDVKFSETVELTNKTLDQTEKSLQTAETTMAEANASLKEMTALLNKISEGEGSIGKMMKDEQLYDNIESTTRNLDLLIQDLRLNPRRYFRLFGKKSRDYEYPEDDPANQQNLEEGK